jgi:hypothetical protein
MVFNPIFMQLYKLQILDALVITKIFKHQGLHTVLQMSD